MATGTRTRRDSTRERFERVLAGLQRRDEARSNPRVLRAAGVKIERMSAERMRAIAGNKQTWQSRAWSYRDAIGELRFALQYRARAISRAQFFIAQTVDDEDEPVPVSLRSEKDDKTGEPTERSRVITADERLCAAAEAELARLPLDSGYGFAGIWSENFDVAGECYLHGRRIDDPAGGEPEEEWAIRSILDIDVQGSDITLKDELGQPRRLDLADPSRDHEGTEELYRLWVPHPARAHLADSAFNALEDVLEDILLAGGEIRAASRSRQAANGIWPVPHGMTLMKNTKKDGSEPEDQSSSFILDITAAFLAPITNEGDPGSVAPIIITGTREDIEVASKSFIRFDRETNPEVIARLEFGLKRMGTSIDLPPEIITGMAEANHWTAWQIDAATFRHYLEPSLRLMVDSLTTAFIRRALLAQGFAPAEVKQIRVWYNADNITENPNRRQDALDARAAGAIGDDPFRAALGFSAADAPTAEERLLMIAQSAGMDTATAAAILAAWTAREGEADLVPTPAPATLPGRAAPARQIGPGQQAPAEQAPPDTAPTGVTAAGTIYRSDGQRWVPVGAVDPDAGLTFAPEPAAGAWLTAAASTKDSAYRLDTTTGRRLMDIDRALRTDLLTATDTALARALERAGSRLRSKLTAQPAVHQRLKIYPIACWSMQLGRTQTLAAGADVRYLLAEAWDGLKDYFARRIRAAIRDVASLVTTKLLRLDGKQRVTAESRLTAAMEARIPDAWNHYQHQLDQHAEVKLFGEDVPDEIGEGHHFAIPPHLARAAVAAIAGLPETSGGLEHGQHITGEPLAGLAGGATVAGALEGAGVLTVGYLWVYGVTPQARRFDPHWDLEGERFTSWADPKLHTDPRNAWVGPFYRPGDHRGCMCDYVPGYAIPEYAEQVDTALSVTTPATQDILDLAAQDDAAGRKGTTAQEVRDQHARVRELQARFMAS